MGNRPKNHRLNNKDAYPAHLKDSFLHLSIYNRNKKTSPGSNSFPLSPGMIKPTNIYLLKQDKEALETPTIDLNKELR
jgi:hypothetical protein